MATCGRISNGLIWLNSVLSLFVLSVHTIVRWLRQAHQIILKLSDHHAILLTFSVVDQAFQFWPVEPKPIHNINCT